MWTDTQSENITFSHPSDAGGKKPDFENVFFRVVMGLVVPLEAELGGLERSLENRRERAPADGRWVKDMIYDVGETFVRDGCKNVKCTCHWDGQVSCRQDGNECKSSFSMKLKFVTCTENGLPEGNCHVYISESIYRTLHNPMRRKVT